MPLALSQFDPVEMNLDFTPSSNYAVNEAKNSALMGEYQRKKEATQRLSGRMPDVQKAIQNHDIMNQGVQDLMEVNPELYKTMADAVKAQDEAAKSRAEKSANFMAGAVPYITGAEDRGQTKEQAWGDYLNFARQSGVPLGQFDNTPYSDNALALLKSSIYGIKGVLEGGATIKQENGALVTRTPLGDVKDVKVLPQERADRPIPMRTYESGNKKITEEYVDGKWRVKATADISKHEKPKAAPEPKLVTTYDDQGNAQFETVMPGQMPKGAPKAPANVTNTEDARKSAGYANRLENALALMTKIESEGVNPTGGANELFAGAADVVGMGNAARSEANQRLEAARLDALDAALTLNTGAAYTKEQLKGIAKSYFPQLFDGKNTIAEKKERLDALINTAKLRAGTVKQGQAQQSAPRQIKSTAEYKALPSGAIFIDPNGVKRRKP